MLTGLYIQQNPTVFDWRADAMIQLVEINMQFHNPRSFS